jgi:predicted outer membrane lipoprotein
MRSLTWYFQWILGFCATLTVIAANTAFASEDEKRIQLAGHEFAIPEHYLDAWSPLSWLRWVPGSDDGGRELLLTIGASEVAAAVDGYMPTDGDYKNDLHIILVVLYEYERARYLDPNQFEDVRNRAGSYRERIVEKDSETNFFRVYRRIEYPASWEVFRTSPDEPWPSDLFSFWIGHCLNSRSPLTPSGSLALCKSFVVVDQIAVHFTINSQNLAETDRIRHYLMQKLDEWSKSKIQPKEFHN